MELHGSFPLTRPLKTAQNLPTSSDEVPLSSDEERATALRPGRTDPGCSASLPLGLWGIGPHLRETQYAEAGAANGVRVGLYLCAEATYPAICFVQGATGF